MTLRARLNAIAREIEKQVGPCPGCQTVKIAVENRRGGRTPTAEEADVSTTCDLCGEERRVVRVVLE